MDGLCSMSWEHIGRALVAGFWRNPGRLDLPGRQEPLQHGGRCRIGRRYPVGGRRGKQAAVALGLEEYGRLRKFEKASAPTLGGLSLVIPQNDQEFEHLPMPFRPLGLSAGYRRSGGAAEAGTASQRGPVTGGSTKGRLVPEGRHRRRSSVWNHAKVAPRPSQCSIVGRLTRLGYSPVTPRGSSISMFPRPAARVGFLPLSETMARTWSSLPLSRNMAQDKRILKSGEAMEP